MKNLLRGIPFVLCNLLATDAGGASGGAADEIPLTEGSSAPAVTGNTLEEKVSSATSLVGKLFTQAKGLFAQVAALTTSLSAASTEKDRIQGLFDAATTEATAAKENVIRLTGELSTMTTARDTEKTRADTATTNVANLEKLCGVKGIDPKDAVKFSAQGPGSVADNADILAKFNAIKDPQEATTFYRANQAAIDAAHKQPPAAK